MANLTKSLAGRLDWRSVLPSLGVKGFASPFLPQIVECPCCHDETLEVMPDHVMGGHWFHCHACHLADDAIGLAAATWRTDPETAITRLEDLGLFPSPLAAREVQGHIRDHVRLRQRFSEFWEKAHLEPMLGTDCPRSLFRTFALADNYWHSSWPSRGGRFFGTASRRQIEELFYPDSYAHQERRNRNGNTSVRRGPGPGVQLFPGHGWDHMLVVPFYDLPGRISGLMMVGREANPETDFVFKAVNRPGTTAPREVGVGMLPSTEFGPDRLLGDDIFVISDVQIGLKLQGRYLRESERPLPIVLLHETHDLKLLHVAAALSRRQLIFWGPTQKVLPAAKRHCGSVSDFEISAKEVDQGLKHRLPQDWLRLIKKNAVPWGVALQREAAKLDSGSLQKLVSALDLSPEEYRIWFNSPDDPASERMSKCAPFKLGTEIVRVGGKDVFESERGWTLSSGEVVCNQPLRIEQIMTTHSNESYYRVAVGATDQTRITVGQAEVERRGLFHCVSRELRRAGNHDFIFQSSWNKHAAFIALSFHQPKKATGSDRIGWNRQTLRIQFPHFAIQNGGNVVDEPVALAVDHSQLPGACLNPPSFLPRQAIEVLSETSSTTQLAWAMAASICHNILAGVAVGNARGVILDGAFAHETGLLAAQAFGCAVTDTSTRRKGVTILASLLEPADRHGWPALIRFRANSQHHVTSAWLDSPAIRNCILPLNRYAALVTGMYGGFTRINAGDHPLPLGPIQRAASHIVSHYVQDIFGKKRGIDEAKRPSIVGILKDIAEWFADNGGNEKAVSRAEKILYFDETDLAASFVELVTRMHVWGDIRVVHIGWEPDSPNRLPAVLYYQDATDDRPAAFGVRPEGVNQTLHVYRSVAVDTGRVRASLEQHGAFFASMSDEHGEVWLIDAEWWNERSRSVRQRMDAA